MITKYLITNSNLAVNSDWPFGMAGSSQSLLWMASVFTTPACCGLTGILWNAFSERVS